MDDSQTKRRHASIIVYTSFTVYMRQIVSVWVDKRFDYNIIWFTRSFLPMEFMEVQTYSGR